ncbi:MAG: bifunctional phosphoribosylaminoimidazolecarboxamide formyltransferase/IMP cyclohydrolase [Chloroflexi bacterium]|nr:bifunctional phosphoribosylaminoimidazolecarboxamide formyltransferase/IMP cyclohydrolase [Chloroflexota bacterium]
MRAIVTVSDKTGLAPFVKALTSKGHQVYSTGGTRKALEQAGVKVGAVSDLTAFPEILDGRVKTLHPNIHAGLLASRNNRAHIQELNKLGISTIDMVVVNLYPFVETVSKEGANIQDALENIDIGGPTLIRAAAKNYPHVLVIVDPADYPSVQERILSGTPITIEERKRLAQKAFQHVALYDTAIARYLVDGGDPFTHELTIGLTRLQSLRYGENPHQKSAFYRELFAAPGTIASAKQLHGKELSHNNIIDADAAWTAATDFPDPTVAVIKHTNPCGLASNDDIAEAYRRAYAGDTVSAFGGIVAFNRKLTLAAAEEVRKIFYEIVIAPGYDADALALLQKKKDLRILEVPLPKPGAQPVLDYRRVSGGMLVQNADAIAEDASTWKVVTQRKPTSQELSELAFAWKACKHIKSNAIVLVKDRAIVGMGAGQPNRVTSVHLALRAAGERAKGTVLGSDAFFPFADGVEMAIQGGVTAIAQPGGSIRDADAIAAADKAGIAMLFTGTRHFKH